MKESAKILREFWEREEEFREIRRRFADWGFIERQPPRIKAVLKYYIETGDLRRACKIANLDISAFKNLLWKARIPTIT